MGSQEQLSRLCCGLLLSSCYHSVQVELTGFKLDYLQDEEYGMIYGNTQMSSLLFVYMIRPNVLLWCRYFPQQCSGKHVLFRRDLCVCGAGGWDGFFGFWRREGLRLFRVDDYLRVNTREFYESCVLTLS